MTVEPVDGPCCAEERAALEGFLKLDTSHDYRAEFIEGEIVVSPPPSGDHEAVFSSIARQIIRNAAVDMDISGHKGLELRRGHHCTRNYLIPDAVFAPLELNLFAGAPSWMPPEGVAMVVEVTSTNAERDRRVKKHCYAKADIPLYLLVDRGQRSVTLFSDPDVEGEDYQEVMPLAFGKPVELPEPFAFALDTSEFQ